MLNNKEVRLARIDTYIKEILKITTESIWKIYEITSTFSKQSDLESSAALERKLEEFQIETIKINYRLTEDLLLSELTVDTRKKLKENLEEISKDCKEFAASEYFEKIVQYLKPIRFKNEDQIGYYKNLGK